MVYIIQDILEDPKKYAASLPTMEAAKKLVKDAESFDREMDEYIPNRYVISKHGYCYNDYSAICGWCTNGICMMMAPDINCPLVRKRAAAQAAGEYADKPALMSGA